MKLKQRKFSEVVDRNCELAEENVRLRSEVDALKSQIKSFGKFKEEALYKKIKEVFEEYVDESDF